MTCVLGMVVRREREIRSFVKTPFYRVLSSFDIKTDEYNGELVGEFKAVEGSAYFNSPLLYKDNGFLEIASAVKLINQLAKERPSYNEDGTWNSDNSYDNQLLELLHSWKRKRRIRILLFCITLLSFRMTVPEFIN